MKEASLLDLKLVAAAYLNIDSECERFIAEGADVNCVIGRSDLDALSNIVYDYWDWIDENGEDEPEHLEGSHLLLPGMTPLMAISIGNGPRIGRKTADVLIKHGAEIDFQSNALDNATALMVATGRGIKTTVQYLLEKGANPNLVDYHGDTAFSSLGSLYDIDNDSASCTLNDIRIKFKLECLEAMSSHVDVNHANDKGETALHRIMEIASPYDDRDIGICELEFMIDKHVNPLIKNKSGETAIDIMVRRKREIDEELYSCFMEYKDIFMEHEHLTGTIDNSASPHEGIVF